MLLSFLLQLGPLLAAIPGLHALAVSNSPLDVAEHSSATRRSTILYHNNGNWEEHATNPSAILFFDHVSETKAQDICASYGEKLIKASSLKKFKLPLQYQVYLGTISSSQQFWPASSSSNDHSLSRPFICTNTAPLVDQVEEPFYSLPKTYVVSNGTTYMGTRTHMDYRFLGIPYTLQPVGDRRLTYPIQWYTNETNYVLNATTYGPTCPTNGGYFDGNAYGLNPWGNAEACVLLNIFTPYIPATENPEPKTLKPVMYWIHGGGGTATDATYDGASLTSRSDIVLVSVNYRLGNFGSLSFNDGYVDGNYGVADLVAALQWVQDHIKAFGGDPSRVTVFGQSQGGEASMWMVKSPKAAGLFTGAILHSAALGPAVTQAEVVNVTVPAVAAVCGNVTGAERLACLRSLSVDEFMNNITWNYGSHYDNYDDLCIVDGVYIANQSVAAARAGQLNDIYFMSGSMPDEGESTLGTVLFPNITTDFNETLYSLAGTQYPTNWPPLVEKSGLWNNGSYPINAYNMTINAYTTIHLTCPGEQFITAALEYNSFRSYYYYNNLRAYPLSYYDPFGLCTFPVGEKDPIYFRCHSGDLYEVFGSYYIFDQPIRNHDDIGHTNLQQDAWGAFARTGNPNPEKAYLQARGYTESLAVWDDFTWEQFDGHASINLQHPKPFMSDLPWAAKCGVVLEDFHLP